MEEVCFECGGKFVKHYDFDTGYAIDKDGHKVCFTCCGKRDLKALESLKEGERVVQYLHVENAVNPYKFRKGYANSESYEIRNWPGTLKIKAYGSVGHHNIAYIQRNVWFEIGDKKYHGVQYGVDSELCYIKRVRG